MLPLFIGTAFAVDLGTHEIRVAGNQPPTGYTATLTHRTALPRDNQGVIEALPDGVYSCGWSKVKIHIEDGWPYAITAQDRATWSTPPSTTTCSGTVSGTNYTATLQISTYTVDYTNSITDFSQGLNITLDPDAAFFSTWSLLPYSSSGYIEETVWARKNGSSWTAAKCRVAEGSVSGYYWLRFEVNMAGGNGTCTSAQDCKCRYRKGDYTNQDTPIVVSQ